MRQRPMTDLELRALAFYNAGHRWTFKAWQHAVNRAKRGEQPTEFEKFLLSEVLK